VIGGSAGSIEALQTIIASLPPEFPASLFVVVHLPADYPSILAKVLSHAGDLPTTSPIDREQIQRSCIYVARPDHHLTIEGGRMRVLRGPRENRHRPAIDPLFRTAAREYGPRVIGVVLSGLQDDGSAGLYAVKRRGGVAIVQDPKETPWSEMPGKALTYASPHYVLQARDIAANLIQLVTASESPMVKKNSKNRKSNGKNHKNKLSGTGGLENPTVNMETTSPEEGEGTPSVFACPECHGVLWELKDEKMVRFRCRVGHSFGTDSLAVELSIASESALWAAVRALEEKAAMQRRVADGMGGKSSVSRRLLDQSAADATNALLIRDMIFRRDAKLESDEVEPEPEQRRKTA